MNLKNSIFEFENSHKGNNGTVLVIGGSPMYTGAPYFSSMAALRSGSDLVYIFTEQSALTPLKVLLPEAIVLEFEYKEWILNRIDICIFGPGLGRPSSKDLLIIQSILDYLISRHIYIIVDGDGIRLAQQFDKNTIFTPNYNENKFIKPLKEKQFKILKGKEDVIESQNKRITVNEPPCQKRVGGQGDILTGVLATLLIKLKNNNLEDSIFNCIRIASIVVRRAGRKAFDKLGISLITRDVLEEVGESLKEM